VSAARIIGIVLVRDEDVFVERAVRNVVDFCDELFLVDHRSRDGTPSILERLDSEFPHIHRYRVDDPSVSHALIEPYAGSPSWVFGVDADEIYDPQGLSARPRLLGGEFDDRWALRSIQLHCRRLDVGNANASGWLAPPSRPTTKLYRRTRMQSASTSSSREFDRTGKNPEGVKPRSRKVASASR
jgi:glycosyltransferase involved in cell wall biosynthesis